MAEQRTVLEGAGLALGAVAHDVAGARAAGGDRLPLAPGGEAAATAPPQPGTRQPIAAELLLLDPRPIALEVLP